MKLPNGNTRIIVIVCAVIVMGILSYFVISGSVFQSRNQMENKTPPINTTPVVPLKIDASFDIMEANISVIKFINSTPATFEEMQLFPELEGYMHGVNNDPEAWHQGWRGVATFEGNISQYDTLVKEICKGKNIYECNRGTLIEYHNQYYLVTIQEYGALKRSPFW
jgi:hypothetical protein